MVNVVFLSPFQLQQLIQTLQIQQQKPQPSLLQALDAGLVVQLQALTAQLTAAAAAANTLNPLEQSVSFNKVEFGVPKLEKYVVLNSACLKFSCGSYPCIFGSQLSKKYMIKLERNVLDCVQFQVQTFPIGSCK